MTGGFRCNHDNIHICRRYDTTKMNVETVSECQCLTSGQIRLDVGFIQSLLLFVGCQNHDNICCLSSFCGCHNGQTLLFSLCPALTAFVQTNNNIHSAFLQVQCMSVTLRTITDNCNSLAVELVNVAVLLIENSCLCHFKELLTYNFYSAVQRPPCIYRLVSLFR